jgi:hypothetical protein
VFVSSKGFLNLKKILLLFVYSLIVFSCNENEDPAGCGVENPVEDIAWIKEAIKFQNSGLAGFAYLVQGTYKGRTVFIMESCCPFCNIITVVQDCRGEVLPDASVSDVINKKVIWKPSSSVCTIP